VYRARQRIAPVVRRTPLEHSPALSAHCDADVHLKLECWQHTRSFKIRGAYNAIASLTPEQRARGLVTPSSGNHGQAVALAARLLGAHALVFVPQVTPEVKQERIRRLGAELRADTADYDEAERAAKAYAAEHGATFVHAYSDPHVVAGQGTVALELLDDLPDIREVVVPVGGGGLGAGIGIALKTVRPDIRVLGAQSTQTPAMHAAFAAGRVVDVPVPPTLADGLAGCTDQAAYERLREVLDELVLVEEDEIADAIRALHATDGVVAEGAAAVAVAAVRSGRVRLRGPAAIIISGGNIDGAKLAAILGN
jgi:threonine dehydratase